MLYYVKYRKQGSWFWRKIKKVIGDSLNQDGTRISFFLEDNTKIEIPMDGTELYFSKERYIAILKNLQIESGNKVVTKND